MTEFNRRRFIEGSASVAAAATLGTGAAVFAPAVHAQNLSFKPEKGAKLRVLRWSRFVQGDIDAYMVNVKRFTEKTGIEVRVDNEGWEDVRPKAAVAANTGAGPDIILSTNDDANLYPDKLLDVTDLAEYIGKKYGGWYPAGQAFLKPDGKKWIGLPLGAAGAMMVYRESMVKAAGFDAFPKDTDNFLKMMKALHAKGTPGGMALGNATGDGLWCNWLMWSFGGKLVDNNNKVSEELPRTQVEGNGRRHPARRVPDRAGRRVDGVDHLLQPDDHEVHKVPAGGEGVPALHDGAGAVRALVDRCASLRCDSARRLLQASDLDLRPQEHALPRRCEEHAAGRLCRQAGLCLGGRGGGLHRHQHGGRGNQRLQDAEGSDGAGPEARRALLQSLSGHRRCRSTCRLIRHAHAA
jgi:hypothetical protein